MRILIIILLTLFSSKSFAKDETNWLMNDSLSMFEWGMLQLDKEVEDYVKEENKKWKECDGYLWEMTSLEDQVQKIKNKKENERTEKDINKLVHYKINANSFKFNGCNHFAANGKIINYDIVYDSSNDKIYIIFGQHVLHNPGLSNNDWDNFEEDVNSKLINSEKCIFNRNKIAAGLFFNGSARRFEFFSEVKDHQIDDNERGFIYNGLDFFFHKYFIRRVEPANLKSHLYSIVNVGVLLGSGFGNEKAIFCWESLRSSSPSIKIGELKSVMKEVFFGLHKDSVFSSR